MREPCCFRQWERGDVRECVGESHREGERWIFFVLKAGLRSADLLDVQGLVKAKG